MNERFIIRSLSPMETIGGCIVLDPKPLFKGKKLKEWVNVLDQEPIKRFNQFINEISKSFLLYGFIFVINIFFLYICIEIFKLNIYISQFMVISFSILLSILGQFLFVFKKN